MTIEKLKDLIPGKLYKFKKEKYNVTSYFKYSVKKYLTNKIDLLDGGSIFLFIGLDKENSLKNYYNRAIILCKNNFYVLYNLDRVTELDYSEYE